MSKRPPPRCAERAAIDIARVDPRLDQLRGHTDVQQLAETIAVEMASPEPSTVFGGDTTAPI